MKKNTVSKMIAASLATVQPAIPATAPVLAFAAAATATAANAQSSTGSYDTILTDKAGNQVTATISNPGPNQTVTIDNTHGATLPAGDVLTGVDRTSTGAQKITATYGTGTCGSACETGYDIQTAPVVKKTPAPTSTATSDSTSTSGSASTSGSSSVSGSQSGPASTASGPAWTTSGPATTTSGPASTTSGPASTTSGPASTTSGPASTTSGPATTTGGKATTTSGPAITKGGTVGDTKVTTTASTNSGAITTSTGASTSGSTVSGVNSTSAGGSGGSIYINNPVAAAQASAADTGIHTVVNSGNEGMLTCEKTSNGRDLSVQVIVGGGHLGGGSKTAPLDGKQLEQCQAYNTTMIGAHADAAVKVNTVQGRYNVQATTVASNEPCIVRTTVSYSTMFDAAEAHQLAVKECMPEAPTVPVGRQSPPVVQRQPRM